ncbi:hypothetical protein ScPMuIL_018664 [Solemya velum]
MDSTVLFVSLLLSCQLHFSLGENSSGCEARDYGKGSVVCVCNATYCDTAPARVKPQTGSYTLYQSTKSGDRFRTNQSVFSQSPSSSVVLSLKVNQSYQTILGFGGAFTDAAGINIKSLSPKAQDKLLHSYYAPEGIEYTVGRIPMGSCDFSTREYSYDDTSLDFNLTKFSLAQEDLLYKIPFIQKAISISQRNISIFGSPWSAPAWMKTNGNMSGNGTLIGKPGGQYYKTWANYFVRFLQEYEKNGIHLWGLTAQNEPTDGNIVNFSFQCMGWTPSQQRDFIALDLGPALEKAGYGHVHLMILDDLRLLLPYWAEIVLKSPEAAKYISGIAVHWYIDALVTADQLNKTHSLFPNKFMLATEACEGNLPWQEHVALGDWYRAESYAHDIIQDLNNWVVGWTDWNIALDMQGGPNWVKNFVDSPIIVNSESDEFYKQPMFYAMGHFSKFVLPDSKRVKLEANSQMDLETTAFVAPDSSVVVQVLNRMNDDKSISIYDPGNGYINTVVPAHSIQTYLWALK